MTGNIATFGMEMEEVLKLASAWAQLELAITALQNARKALGMFNPADLPAPSIKQSTRYIRRMAKDIERLVDTQEGNEGDDDGGEALGEGMRRIVVNLPKTVPKSESNTEMKLKWKSEAEDLEPTKKLPPSPVPEIPKLPPANITTKQSGSGAPKALQPGHKQTITTYNVKRTKPDFRTTRLNTRPLPEGLTEQNARGLYHHDCQLHGVQGSYEWFRDNLESWSRVDATVVAVEPTQETQPVGGGVAGGEAGSSKKSKKRKKKAKKSG